jgi:hypothetical protein
MLNWLLRYQPIIRVLDDLRPDTVLGVGAGAHGLSLYWPGKVVQTDISFDAAPADRAGVATLVAASADALPFGDGAFDIAVSIDMVEHLPPEIRASSISELCRVSRRAIVVAYPVGEVAARADKAVAAALRARRYPIPPWLAEHLAQPEYPSHSLVQSSLPPSWRVTGVEREHNVWLQVAVCLAETTPLERVTARVERWGVKHRLPQPLRVGGSYRSYYIAEREV